MTETSLDVLHEIFRDSDPTDLLHLSWASKHQETVTLSIVEAECMAFIRATQQALSPCLADFFAMYNVCI